MNARNLLLIALSAVLFIGVRGYSQSAGLQTFSGEIMDDLCAKEKTHANMMEQMKSMGNDPAVCSRKCVQLGAKYVLYDRAKDTVYSLADQDKAEQYAGRKVRISGSLEKKKIKIAKIEAAESEPQNGK